MSDSSFVKKAAIAGVLLAAGALAAWLVGSPFQTRDDDDRPPIIVNNGSVTFTAVPLLGSTGSWNKVSDRIWHHDLPTKKGPDKFRIHIGGSDTPGCQGQAYRNIERVVFLHSGSTEADPNPITVSVFRESDDLKYLRVESAGLGIEASGAVLTVGPRTDIRVTKASLYKRNGNLEKSCDYSSTPQFLIEQNR